MFGPDCIAAIRRHAMEAHPRESCGAVVAGSYLPLPNMLPDEPASPGAPSARDAFDFDERLVLQYGADLQALVHSHPDGPAYPSLKDQIGQLSWALPWGITVSTKASATVPFWWGDGTPRLPYLEPRGFHWIVNDCYSLIRDAFRQEHGITLKDFPREWGAWRRTPENPQGFSGYIEHFKAGGFVKVDDPQPWDLGVLKFGTKAPSHAGIYLGRNLFLHHLSDDESPVAPYLLSRRVPLGNWRKYIDHGGFWLRYAR